MRIVTTGGGGWGDPLLREVDMVVYDVQCGLISPESATEDYGVVLTKVGRKWQADARQDRATPPSAREPARQSADVRSRPAFRGRKAAGRMKYPEGWSDPDAGWYANSVREADVGSDLALGA